MSRQIFSDPQRKRWKRLRRVFDVTAIVSTVVLVVFFLNILRQEPLPELLLPVQKRNYKALQERRVTDKTDRSAKLGRPARRKTTRKPSEIPLNSGEGLRAAYYVDDDPASYSSLAAHVHQIDILFPVWLHAFDPNGNLMASTSLFPASNYRVVDDNGTVHGVDPQNKIRDLIKASKEDTEIFPLISNYDATKGDWQPSIGEMLLNPQARLNLRTQLDKFLAANPDYHGLSLDFEEVPDEARLAYQAFISELYADLSSRKLRLYVNTPTSASDDELKFLAHNTDGILLMNYDQHENTSEPGPIAAQDWFENNLQRALKLVPKQKIICAIGNYGYDWTVELPAKGSKTKGEPKVLSVDSLSAQDAWQEAADAGADLHLEGDELNAHFAFDDEDAHVRHQVWLLDSVTALNEMRAARAIGIQTFSLWVLGEEDPSLWAVWDHPSAKNAPQLLQTVPPGQSLSVDGDGDILRVTDTPKTGSRTVNMDAENQTITDERMTVFPKAFSIQYYGYKPGEVAITFDDGPDPEWTPKILKILKEKNVKATFFVIGDQAQNNVGLLRDYINQGHEIGNHTFFHPDISEIPPWQVDTEINLTERLFAAKLGLRPLYFRPPYSIDQEPDTNDQAAPAYRIQQKGYTIVGDKIDTNDWDEHPRKTPQEITQSVFDQLAVMKDKPQFRSSIILMHDGGGDRSVTVAALPMLIDALRAHGYKIVNVSDLMDKTRVEVMPPIAPGERWQARVDSVAFFFFGFFSHFVVSVFFVGDVLMSARLLLIGLFALIDRLRKRKVPVIEGFMPRVAILVPAYNEETVIVRTIRSVLNSDYPNLHVIVIDDGSTDRTAEVAMQAYAAEIALHKLQVMTKPNAGKAEALNFAVATLTEDFYVGIDADTVIASDAVSKLICHFTDPKVGAVAGNARVGNKVNLWTRWQALEYITSQNFERRALDLFDVVTVVPGAIGAWRTEAVRHGGGYPVNTVAEDADLTMNLLEQGYKVIYEDQSLAFTEAPINANGLMRQRFRWSFGTLQAVFKHKRAFVNNKAMGLFALPNILVFQILLPLVSPFIDLMFVAGVVHYLLDRHFHPEAASPASFHKLLLYFLTFLIIDFVTSSLAFSLERKHPAKKGDNWLLFHIWLQRFAYRQVFSLVLFKTVKRAIDGRPFNWDKLERTAKMSAETEKIAAGQ
jgi:cellulose synthase/poly-beta-1,6-N-acetylglucosamine synthase-like glycosyltransferase/peptidoglycan/xylan/chitin deacetylase (PgdA/CDA1 family)/spore germination protein YaaH